MRNSLEIEATDFGPIAEAKVGLRPLTVFVGPSNTGKSYLAILIYALHRCFGNGVAPIRWRHSRGLPHHRLFAVPSPKINDSVQELTRTLSDKKRSKNDNLVLAPGPIMDWIRSEFEWRGGASDMEIARCFGVEEIGSLARKRRATGARKDDKKKRTIGARIVLRQLISKDREPREHELAIKKTKLIFQTTLSKEESVEVFIDNAIKPRLLHYASMISQEETDGDTNRYFQRLMSIIYNVALPGIANNLNRPAFYLPADRTGVMHAHSVVVSALIRDAATAGIRPAAPVSMLSGVLSDFLDQLINVDTPPRRRYRRGEDHGAKIEESILRGVVNVERSDVTGYPRFMYRPAGWKKSERLPLMRASSMVSELAPVVLYLRHVVQPGDLLIVEEPESHLHPSMQVAFTRQLAALVRSGVRVLVTTHSEWLLEELANVVRRSELAEDHPESLHPDQVGAWLFKDKGEGSVVTEIGLDESGLYPSGFDDVATALYNESADISSRIENPR